MSMLYDVEKVAEKNVDVGEGAAQGINSIPDLELFRDSFLAMLYELNRLKLFNDVFFWEYEKSAPCFFSVLQFFALQSALFVSVLYALLQFLSVNISL